MKLVKLMSLRTIAWTDLGKVDRLLEQLAIRLRLRHAPTWQVASPSAGFITSNLRHLRVSYRNCHRQLIN